MIVRLLIKWGTPILAALTVMAVADRAAAQSCPDTTCPPPPPPCDTGCPPVDPPPPPPPPPCDQECPPPPCEYDCEPPPPPPCEDYSCQPPPGVDIDIDVNVNAEASAYSRAQARTESFAAGRGVGGGLGAGSGLGRGYASFGVQAPAPTSMSGFVVQGPARIVRVPYRASRSMMRRVRISAVCMDSRSVPHPASRVRPDEDISDDYEGELYRCITGAWLQVTMSGFGEYEGASSAWCYGASARGSSSYSESSYSREEYSQGGGYASGGHGGYGQGGNAQGGGSAYGGSSSGGSSYGGSAYQCREDAPPDCIRASQGGGGMPDFCLTGGGGGFEGSTLTCRQGEALYHGRGGRLECRPQTQERDCFERSLLRRYGAGEFILTMMREESYEEWREETVVESYSGMSVVFDGGVGGRVY